jgi:Lipocalin-like domain
MIRHNIPKLLVLIVVGLGSPQSNVTAQQGSLKRQLVGTWTYVSSTAKLPDGTPLWGPNPRSLLIFTDNGRFSWQVFRSDRPHVGSNDRRDATADENKAIMQGSLAYFGTYSVNEADKTLMSRIEGATFPNSEGEEQKRIITRLTADELRYSNPETTLGASVEAVWRRVR